VNRTLCRARIVVVAECGRAPQHILAGHGVPLLYVQPRQCVLGRRNGHARGRVWRSRPGSSIRRSKLSREFVKKDKTSVDQTAGCGGTQVRLRDSHRTSYQAGISVIVQYDAPGCVGRRYLVGYTRKAVIGTSTGASIIGKVKCVADSSVFSLRTSSWVDRILMCVDAPDECRLDLSSPTGDVHCVRIACSRPRCVRWEGRRILSVSRADRHPTSRRIGSNRTR
jgi:hypothetical protein